MVVMTFILQSRISVLYGRHDLFYRFSRTCVTVDMTVFTDFFAYSRYSRHNCSYKDFFAYLRYSRHDWLSCPQYDSPTVNIRQVRQEDIESRLRRCRRIDV